MASLEELLATVERMEARASAQNDPSLAESRRLYAELAKQFEADLPAPRDVALAKSAALMVLQALAQARRGSALWRCCGRARRRRRADLSVGEAGR
jgi:hypothetical protein